MNRFHLLFTVITVAALNLPQKGTSQAQPVKHLAAAKAAIPTATADGGDTPAPDPPPLKPGVKQVRLKLNGKAFIDQLPFDVPFQITGEKYDPSLISISFAYKQGPLTRAHFAEADFSEPWLNNFDDQSPFVLRALIPLLPNRPYTFEFRIKRKLTEDETGKMTSLISDQLLSLLKQRLNDRNDFELEKTEVENASEAVITTLAKYLQTRQLTLDRAGLKDNYYGLIKSSLLGLSRLYDTTFHEPLIALNANTSFFFNEGHMLDSIAGHTSHFAASPEYTTLKNDLAALKTFSENMDPDVSLSEADLTNVLNTLSEAIANTKESVAPQSAKYKSEMPNILDMLQFLQRKMLLYKAGPASAQEGVEKFAGDLTTALANIIYADLIVSEDNLIQSYEIRASYYMSMDIGVAFFPALGRATPYLGTNIYLRPVNKDRPIYSGDYNPLRSFSFLVGVSFVSVAKTGRRDDLIGNTFNLLGGMGYRVTDNLRLNGGWVFFKKTNTNPLIGDEKIGVNGFFSVSFDYDIGSAFKSLFNPTPLKTE